MKTPIHHRWFDYGRRMLPSALLGPSRREAMRSFLPVFGASAFLLTVQSRSLAALANTSSPLAPADWDFATPMLSATYVDMPYMVRFPDGKLLSTVTYNLNGPEGHPDQHVGVITSTDNGATWSAPFDLEPPEYPESSWATPFHDTAADRLYVFYIYNHANVRPPEGGLSRAESIGRIVFKYSDDRGTTWSPRQYIGPLPAKAIDRRNPWGGTDFHQLIWLHGHPFVRGGKLYLPFSKTTDSGFKQSEAFLLRLDWSPASAARKPLQLPTGPDGIKAPTAWPDGSPLVTKICEESFAICHDDGLISVVCRGDAGRLYETWSSDGVTFAPTDWARLSDGTRTVYQPRGPSPLFKLRDGRVLLWTYNNDGTNFQGRNPVWYRLGERVGDRLRWGEPYALCYDADMKTRIGYPSLIETDDEILIAASDKSSARLMRFAKASL